MCRYVPFFGSPIERYCRVSPWVGVGGGRGANFSTKRVQLTKKARAWSHGCILDSDFRSRHRSDGKDLSLLYPWDPRLPVFFPELVLGRDVVVGALELVPTGEGVAVQLVRPAEECRNGDHFFFCEHAPCRHL